MASLKEVQGVNSTTYVDLLGVSLGLDRLPGETSGEFLERLQRAAQTAGDKSYRGLLEEISVQLALAVEPYIRITSSDTGVLLSLNLAGLVLGSQPAIPLLVVSGDGVWEWRKLSEVVADVNQVNGFSAELLVDDGPALQLSRQSNRLWVVNEPVKSATTRLAKAGVLLGSERFSTVVTNYTLSADGVLRLASEPNPGLTVSYQYTIWPYEVVGSQTGMFALTDDGVASVSLAADGSLVHQMQETLQSIMERDRSYWAK